MARFCISLACIILLASGRHVAGQPAGGSPRRTRNVEIIERYGASVVAIFTQDKDDSEGSGSGSVIHRDGYILTNDHVVQGRPGVVLYRDLPPLPFRTVGRVQEEDLALIKVDAPKPMVALPLGRSDDLAPGEPILVGGNPGGRGVVFSAGIVRSPNVIPGMSALTMSYYRDDTRDRFIQFDAATNPGSSGGPVINAEGRQVGVVVAKSFEEQAINYAIPVDRANQAFHDLLLPEERGNFWAGVELDLAAPTVRRVVPESPAEHAGLRPGDTITALDDGTVASSLDYLVNLVGRKPGERIAVKYRRNGKPGDAQLLLAGYPVKLGIPLREQKAGLRFRLYRGRFTKIPDFSSLKPARQGSAASLELKSISGLPEGNYALVLEGYLEIPAAGIWSLAIASDDGSRLFLDDHLVANNDGPHPLQAVSGRRLLGKGLHPARIEFFQATGEAELQVRIARDGSSAMQEPKFFFDSEARP
jgi:serine protease Do